VEKGNGWNAPCRAALRRLTIEKKVATIGNRKMEKLIDGPAMDLRKRLTAYMKKNEYAGQQKNNKGGGGGL